MTMHLNLLEQYFGEYDKKGHDYYFYCPNRCHKYKKKLSVDLERGKYHCWICGYGGTNLFWLFMKFFPENRNLWSSYFDMNNQKGREMTSKVGGSEEIYRVYFEMDIRKYSLLVCDYWNKLPESVKSYLERKRITRDDSFLWNIRCTELLDSSIMIPSIGINNNIDYYLIRFLGNNNYKFTSVLFITSILGRYVVIDVLSVLSNGTLEYRFISNSWNYE
ncbi:MAG: hypothetical protein N3A54_01015 [Patescibacteria group bacterium]|nr:hypothetical protein [Patescibacteria group bacterium]